MNYVKKLKSQSNCFVPWSIFCSFESIQNSFNQIEKEFKEEDFFFILVFDTFRSWWDPVSGSLENNEEETVKLTSVFLSLSLSLSIALSVSLSLNLTLSIALSLSLSISRTYALACWRAWDKCGRKTFVLPSQAIFFLYWKSSSWYFQFYWGHIIQTSCWT